MSSAHTKDLEKVWSRLAARSWSDEAFRKRLLANPTAVLKEEGVSLSPGIQVKVHEDSDRVLNLIVPQKPSGEILEADLEKVAAAGRKPGIETDL